MPRKFIVKLILSGLLAIIVVIAAEVISAIYQPLTPFQNPDRMPQQMGGKGRPLTYLVLGDSTAAGQGAHPWAGIASSTAAYLSRNYHVELVNMGISGARAADVLNEQVPNAVGLKPDLVLISVGANDATHLTPSSAFAQQISLTVALLRTMNPKVKIVVTGCPDMGSVPRFAQPLRWFAGTQADRINTALAPVIQQDNLVNADIAGTTGSAFRKDPTLFASDKFHPNDQGYKIWCQVLDKSLTSAMSQ